MGIPGSQCCGEPGGRVPWLLPLAHLSHAQGGELGVVGQGQQEVGGVRKPSRATFLFLSRLLWSKLSLFLPWGGEAPLLVESGLFGGWSWPSSWPLLCLISTSLSH